MNQFQYLVHIKPLSGRAYGVEAGRRHRGSGWCPVSPGSAVDSSWVTLGKFQNLKPQLPHL